MNSACLRDTPENYFSMKTIACRGTARSLVVSTGESFSAILRCPDVSHPVHVTADHSMWMSPCRLIRDDGSAGAVRVAGEPASEGIRPSPDFSRTATSGDDGIDDLIEGDEWWYFGGAAAGVITFIATAWFCCCWCMIRVMKRMNGQTGMMLASEMRELRRERRPIVRRDLPEGRRFLDPYPV